MSETANIAKMAEKVSEDIFEVFGWERILPSDQNWECVTPEHDKPTHPSDVVFRYKHPYSDTTVYFTTDLKSFAKDSITKQQVSKAIASLGISATCAGVSEAWQDLYLAPDTKDDVRGLLFIYNHDGEYKGDFNKLLAESSSAKTGLTDSTMIHVIGPYVVSYLATVANDINVLRGKKKLPADDSKFWFFYPDLIGEPSREPHARSATIETLCGPLIVCEYIVDGKSGKATTGALIYYSRSGESVDEFKYILDYLFRYQLLSNCDEIQIRMANAVENASATFKRAVDSYVADVNDLQEVRDRLARVSVEHISDVIKVFSKVKLGMEERP
ncbi:MULTISPECIES: hypothetical protein [Stenotrophomonas]|uniref:hypothetical protein n=1 Tax=Stenotrophomonas TaxID=40323 RepID=UPI0007700E92|nr:MULTISPECIES: hypothetical protein [Stenotrophomonas]AMJ56223.1 hypothetical protein AXG53_05840 [Stenotrophomonas sp. KCTC 12332]